MNNLEHVTEITVNSYGYERTALWIFLDVMGETMADRLQELQLCTWRLSGVCLRKILPIGPRLRKVELLC